MHQNRRVVLFLILFLVTTLLAASTKPVESVTWSTQIHRLTTHDFFDGYSSITQLSNGVINVVWSKAALMGNLKIYYKNSSDYGNTWSMETNLTNIFDEYQDIGPSITQTSDETIWVVWSSNRPPPPQPPKPDFSIDASPKNLTIPQNSFNTSTIIITSLLGFNEPVNLLVFNEPENVTATLDPHTVTPPPNGTANSTLTVQVGNVAIPGNYTLVVSGRSPEQMHSVEIGLEIIESSTLEYGASSLVYSAEKEEEEDEAYSYFKLYYKISQDGGITWSNDTLLEPASPSEDRSPSIVQAMNGTIWIVWQSYRTGNSDIFCKTSSDGGGSWSDAANLTWSPYSDRSPSITQTMDGKIWVTWSSDRTGHWEVYYKNYNGTLWTDNTRLTYNDNIDTSPSILETFDETLWIFFSSSAESADDLNDIFYKYLSKGEVTWSDRIQFTTDASEDSWASTTQTRDTRMWIAWSSNRTGDMELFYRTSLVGDLAGPEDPPGSGQYPPDGIVDTYDLALVAEAYGKKQGDPDWDMYESADLTGPENPPDCRRYPPDGIIEVYDLAAVGKNYDET